MQASVPEGKLIGVLQTCRQKRDQHEARRLLAFLRQQKLDSHPILGNYLVPTLVECGDLPDAQNVFDRLPAANEHAWTALISGYTLCGKPRHALQLYRNMQGCSSLQPNMYTYLPLLGACSCLGDADSGREIHAEIAKRGLEGHLLYHSPVVGNTLVDTYAKCGLLADARRVFDLLPVRNTVSWSAMIAGYAERGLGNETGAFLQQMCLDGVSPDSVMFVCSLKACSSVGTLQTGQEIYTQTTMRGLEMDICLGSSLVDMYIKCGSLAEAQQVFNRIPDRDAVSWATLIAGYAEDGLDEGMRNCFHLMHSEGVCADAVMLASSLKCYGALKALEPGREMHAEIIKKGLERELYIGSTLVDMYCKCGSLAEARQAFDGPAVRDAVLWNALMTGYAEHDLDEEVTDCFYHMQRDGICPDPITYVCRLKSCGSMGDITTGQITHARVISRGWEKELFLMNTLVDVYIRCSSLVEARCVFDRLLVRDAVTWATMVVGYAEHGLDNEVLNVFKQMQMEGVSVDVVTSVVCLKACGTTGALETGQEIHAEIRKLGLEGEPSVGSMLVDMYGRCGLVAEARDVFNNLSVRNVVSWTSMIQAYGENHEGNMAVQCFEDMQEQGVKPDSITFVCLLAACSHASLVLKGQTYFILMKAEHGIEPTSDHYACMVDLFSRAGHMHLAENFIVAMQCAPASMTLMALLTGCKIYGRLALGERCFHQILEENQEDASAYLLMVELYRNAGRWHDAYRLEEMRTYLGAKKTPGTALIEVNKMLQDFVVGANKTKELVESLEILSLPLRNKGYVPVLDMISSQTHDEDKETSIAFVNKCSVNLSVQKDNIIYNKSFNVFNVAPHSNIYDFIDKTLNTISR